MANKKTYYITTPIYYPSGKWHLGTCYTTVVCDAIARFKRLQGFDVFYLTGTDEHGLKIQRKAQESGIDTKKYLDRQIESLKKVWTTYDISYNKFIRTTDKEHEQAVQRIFQKLYDKGDIYKSEYEGWYCVPCESYWTKSQLKDGKCPDCGRDVELTKESSYFFRLSKYQSAIERLYAENPDFLEPKSRMNEMLNNFIKPGLQDISVSRTTFDWGIPVPFDPKHVIYVWIDALTNYITALGYASDDDSLYQKYWPADVHMMAKEIVRFHSIIWPALLMALDIPLPKKIFGHGWLLFGNSKMSKSVGNVIDPLILADRYGIDAIRYYLLRDVPFGQDGNYTNELLLNRVNSDLANTFGNLVSRTLAMLTQYFGGKIPQPTQSAEDSQLISACENMLKKAEGHMDALEIPDAVADIFDVLQRANKYIDENEPWVLFREGKTQRLATVMYNLAEAIRFACVALQPFITRSPVTVLDAFGVDAGGRTFKSIEKFGYTKAGVEITRIQHLFPRYDIAKEIAELDKIADAEMKQIKPAEAEAEKPAKAQITIDDFDKTELKVGKVLAAEKVEKSDKLLKLIVDTGEKERTIVSGIAKYYTAEEMVGKLVVVVANLTPAKLRGIVSEGMILCAADDKGNLKIVTPEGGIAAGSGVN